MLRSKSRYKEPTKTAMECFSLLKNAGALTELSGQVKACTGVDFDKSGAPAFRTRPHSGVLSVALLRCEDRLSEPDISGGSFGSRHSVTS